MAHIQLLFIIYAPTQAETENQLLRIHAVLQQLKPHGDVKVDLLLIGDGVDQIVAVPSLIEIRDAFQLILSDYSAESITESLTSSIQTYTHVFCFNSTFCRDWFPRLAAILDVQPITDVIRIDSDNSFSRYIYAGHFIETLRSQQTLNMVSLRASSFSSLNKSEFVAVNVNMEKFAPVNADYSSQLIESFATQSSRPELSRANRIVSGGRGVGSKEQFKLIEGLADLLDAAVGASRAAVDAGYISNDFQIGQTGKIVSPDLYLAIGISGAVQHLAGMKDSRVIAAINNDADAPIFDVADVGFVGDLFEIVPNLSERIRNAKKS